MWWRWCSRRGCHLHPKTSLFESEHSGVLGGGGGGCGGGGGDRITIFLFGHEHIGVVGQSDMVEGSGNVVIVNYCQPMDLSESNSIRTVFLTDANSGYKRHCADGV